MVVNGPHTRWRSVPREDAEQCENGTKTPEKAGIRASKKSSLVFRKECGTMEHLVEQ
jgi:hypothetical protein